MNRDLRDALLVLAIVVPLCIVPIPFILRAMRAGRRRMEDRVDCWAKSEGYRLVSKEQSLFGGPFWSWWELVLHRDGPVYRVVVEGRDGRRRVAHLWLRVESALDAYSSEGIDVRWD